MAKFMFGFELEGFFRGSDGVITAPPKSYPRDGFPGLVEIRTFGGAELDKAITQLTSGIMQYTSVDYSIDSYTFPAEKKALIRKLYGSNKQPLEKFNLYGSKPKLYGNLSTTSLQVNFSSLLRSDRVVKEVTIPAAYGLFNFHSLILALDAEFAKEIKDSKRQKGEFCIKENTRLEYRSLPSSVITSGGKASLESIKSFSDRIAKVTSNFK